MIQTTRRYLRNRRFRLFGQSLGLEPEQTAHMIDLGYSAGVECYGDEVNVIVYAVDGFSRIMVLPARNVHQASLWTAEFNRRTGEKIQEGERS